MAFAQLKTQSLSEIYQKVMPGEGKEHAFGLGQKIQIHKAFNEYDLAGDIYHEAGFDALMTGVCWLKLMAYLNPEKKFAGVESILNNDIHN